jgi:hypothetical protein
LPPLVLATQDAWRLPCDRGGCRRHWPEFFPQVRDATLFDVTGQLGDLRLVPRCQAIGDGNPDSAQEQRILLGPSP